MGAVRSRPFRVSDPLDLQPEWTEATRGCEGIGWRLHPGSGDLGASRRFQPPISQILPLTFRIMRGLHFRIADQTPLVSRCLSTLCGRRSRQRSTDGRLRDCRDRKPADAAGSLPAPPGPRDRSFLRRAAVKGAAAPSGARRRRGLCSPGAAARITRKHRLLKLCGELADVLLQG